MTATIRIPAKQGRIRKPRIMHERDKVQKPVVQFLEIDGWRMFRTELAVQKDRGRVVGEVGQPDYLAIRYWASYRVGAVGDIGDQQDMLTEAQVMWLEFKRGKGGRISKAQALWHAAERQRGALVLVVSDFDAFRAWYLASGLNRRIKG